MKPFISSYESNWQETFFKTFKNQNDFVFYLGKTQKFFGDKDQRNPLDMYKFLKNAGCHTIDVYHIDPKKPIASMDKVHAVMEYISNDFKDKIHVVVGSGSLLDTIKHALYLKYGTEVSLWSIPTATSVTAYSSPFAVLEENSHKKTYPSLLPSRVIWVEQIIWHAPTLMNLSGLGDALAIITSSYDIWFQKFIGVSTQSLSQDKVYSLINLIFSIQDFDSTKPLTDLLIQLGLMCGEWGSTSIISGFEHAFSHTLDLLSHEYDLFPLQSHGLQVGLATLTLTGLEKSLNNVLLDEDKTEKIKAHCNLLKIPYAHAIEIYQYKKSILKNVNLKKFKQEKPFKVSYEKLREFMVSYNIPITAESLGIPLKEFNWALNYAPFYRDRMSFWDGQIIEKL